MAGAAAAATFAWAVQSRADAPCGAVQASPALRPAWSAAAAELGRQLAQLPAGDCQPMTLSIEPDEAGARLGALAADGRRTERVVRRPESLVATGLGLVMAIPPAAAPARAAANTPQPVAGLPPSGSAELAPVPAAAAAHGSAAPTVPAGPSPVAVTRDVARRVPSLWVGIEAGGRIAQPTSIAMADLSLDGTLLLDPWLISVAIRSTPLGLASAQGLDRDAFRQVAIGLGAGRRLQAGDAMIDVIMEPAVTAMRMEYDFGNGVDSRGEDVELSVDAVARLALPVGKGWALTLTLEGDAIPGNLGNAPARVDTPPGQSRQAPQFPAWESALRLGVMGALL